MKKITGKSLGGEELVNSIIDSAKEKLAEAIVVLDIRGLPGTADWFIICQGDNTVHNRAISDGIIDHISSIGTHPWHKEGTEDGRWVLIDYSDVVVHVMLPELREYYNLEELWSAGKRMDISDTHTK